MPVKSNNQCVHKLGKNSPNKGAKVHCEQIDVDLNISREQRLKKGWLPYMLTRFCCIQKVRYVTIYRYNGYKSAFYIEC